MNLSFADTLYFKKENILEIKIDEKFIGERGRINCSLRAVSYTHLTLPTILLV